MKQCKKNYGRARLDEDNNIIRLQNAICLMYTKGKNTDTSSGCLMLTVVNCSKKSFAAQKQYKWNASLPVFGNAVRLYVVDSHIYTKDDGNGKYCSLPM